MSIHSLLLSFIRLSLWLIVMIVVVCPAVVAFWTLHFAAKFIGRAVLDASDLCGRLLPIKGVSA